LIHIFNGSSDASIRPEFISKQITPNQYIYCFCYFYCFTLIKKYHQMKNITFASFVYIFVLLISGCASVSEIPQKTTAQLLEESSAALSSGKRETAIALLDTASKNNPGSAAPWLKQAQVHFEADNYPAAIQAADEAMKRDPASKEAKAIAVVASLRVAIRALADMSQDSTLRGTNRSEAERLARALRDTLDQDVLVPLAPTKAGSPRTSPVRGTKPDAISATRQAQTPTPVVTAPKSATPSATGSPFGALK
jgi:tetratricopeptide (TPR) repeat protein